MRLNEAVGLCTAINIASAIRFYLSTLFLIRSPDRGGQQPPDAANPPDCAPSNGQLPPVHPMQKSLARVIVPSTERVELEFWGHSRGGR
ncbi:hypothetical protein K0M31_010398, partial [Melipona bicolor]